MSDLAETARQYINLHGRGGFVDGMILRMAERIEELERQRAALRAILEDALEEKP